MADPPNTTRADVHAENCGHMHHTIDSEIKQMTDNLVSFRKKKKEKIVPKRSCDQTEKNVNGITVDDRQSDSESLDSNNPFKTD